MNTNSVRFFDEHPVEKPGPGAELIVAAWKLANAENMGKIIRLGHNVGASKVLFIHGNEEHRLAKIKKTAGFSYEQMSWVFISEEEFERDYLPHYSLSVLETCDGATNIFTTALNRKTILLGGSESHGIPANIIKKSTTRVFIPIPGGSKSLNISNALSVAAFEWLRQTNYAG
jgi:tRNA G18 (ribose-2'-O)-methylase SpoU